jgi:hypothetical protein
MNVDNMDIVRRATGGCFRNEMWDIKRKANGF